MIDRPVELVFPLRLFHDTRYHLGEEATRLRTDHLIDRLAAALDRSPRSDR